MQISREFSLKEFNTFGIDAKAKFFVEVFNQAEIDRLLENEIFTSRNHLLLGAGSNILFTRDFDGMVVKVNLKGIDILEENDCFVKVKAGAGENWDEFVSYCVEKNYAGLENLSLIPGNVGSSPIQNIGAYGVEVKHVITSVDTLEIETLQEKQFTNEECNFGYRDSIFKRDLKGKHIITHVSFRLNKVPKYKLEYGNLKEGLKRFEKVDLESIRQSVIDIRNSKLPKPEELGNSGSFFKNPIVTASKAKEMLYFQKAEHVVGVVDIRIRQNDLALG